MNEKSIIIPGYEPKWWKEAIVYQIYPRSFQDSNGDGIGDLPGILSRIDYIAGLGIDVVWLSPIFASPNDDNGYDISDYRAIMPEFGTMEDFERLLRELHRREIRMILDLVANHTSDEHPWFVEAKKSRENPYYDYYHWWPAEKGEPPFRASYFDENGYGWKFNPDTDSWYLHYFSRKQPDLNWHNRKVREEIYEVMRFWLDKGVDGFRMDSIPLIGKDPDFPEIDPEIHPYVFDEYVKCPVLHDYLNEMNREVLCHYDILTVGEGSAVKCPDAGKFVEPDRNELQMLYHFGPSEVRSFSRPDGPDTGIPYSLVSLKKMFFEWDRAVGNGWPSVYLGNHDQPRMVSRFADDSDPYRELSSKMLITFLLTLRGTVYWYAGDEIGMANPRFSDIRDYRDIATLNEYRSLRKTPKNVKRFLRQQMETSRDNARTPFQWDDSPNGGFTDGMPWIRSAPDYRKVNACREEHDPDSVLNYFREFVALRKRTPCLLYGDFEPVDMENQRLFSYTRSLGTESLLVVLNFSPCPENLPNPRPDRYLNVLANNYKSAYTVTDWETIECLPFQSLVLSAKNR